MPCWISVLNMARAQACPSLGSFDCKNGRLLTRPKLGCRLLLLHGPRLRRPKSKIQTGRWVLDLTLDFGFWVLDFGFWISDCCDIRSSCGRPKHGRLDFGFWLLAFVRGLAFAGDYSYYTPIRVGGLLLLLLQN